MATGTKKLNAFIMYKVPAAWLCGVRIRGLDQDQCTVRVRHRWINQNPFNSMYFAVQAMAAELSTGALVMQEVRRSGKRISMLVKANRSSFSKKATGLISFVCTDGEPLRKAIEEAMGKPEGTTLWMESIGTNKEGVEVSRFHFEWTLRVKE